MVSTFFTSVFILAGCGSTPVLPSDSAMMNIWVAPEYMGSKSRDANNYIAVVVTGVPNIGGENGIKSVVK